MALSGSDGKSVLPSADSCRGEEWSGKIWRNERSNSVEMSSSCVPGLPYDLNERPLLGAGELSLECSLLRIESAKADVAPSLRRVVSRDDFRDADLESFIEAPLPEDAVEPRGRPFEASLPYTQSRLRALHAAHIRCPEHRIFRDRQKWQLFLIAGVLPASALSAIISSGRTWKPAIARGLVRGK